MRPEWGRLYPSRRGFAAPQDEAEGEQHTLHAPFPIQLSNSQASSLSRTASRASFGFSFRWLPHIEGADCLLPKEGAERRRAHPGCLPFAKDRRPACEPASPYGAPLRRLKSLVPHCPLPRLSPVVGRVRDIDPGPRIGPGGCPPRTPGTAVSETAGAGAAPHPRLDSLGQASLRGWG
jgi:hypothetical protein